MSLAYDSAMTPMLVLLLAAAQPAAPPAADQALPTIPPATLDDTLEIDGEDLPADLNKRMFIEARVNGSGPYRFLVDSGADRSVVGSRLAARLALPTERMAKLQSMAGLTDVSTVRVESLTLGKSTIGDLVVPALPERFIGAHGLIGIDALAEQRIKMDFDTRTVTIEDKRVPLVAEAGEIVVTARRRKGQLILTQCNVGGTQVYAVIDTGTDITVANLALARAVLGRVPPLDKTITMVSVTGQSFEARLATLPSMRIGGLIIENVTIAFADAAPFALFGIKDRPALLLGTDVLKSFRRMSLDFRNRRVRFTLRRP